MSKRCRFCAEEIQFAALVCRFCGRDQRIYEVKPSGSNWTTFFVVGFLFLFGAGLTAAGYVFYVHGGANEHIADLLVPRPPLVVKLVDENYVRIPARSSNVYEFQLDDARPCRLRGRILVTDGGKHDITVLITNEDGVQNFQNGNTTDTYAHWERRSVVTLDEPLRGYQKYYLVISNRFSIFTSKAVSLRNIRGVCGGVDSDRSGDA